MAKRKTRSGANVRLPFDDQFESGTDPAPAVAPPGNGNMKMAIAVATAVTGLLGVGGWEVVRDKEAVPVVRRLDAIVLRLDKLEATTNTLVTQEAIRQALREAAAK